MADFLQFQDHLSSLPGSGQAIVWYALGEPQIVPCSHSNRVGMGIEIPLAAAPVGPLHGSGSALGAVALYRRHPKLCQAGRVN